MRSLSAHLREPGDHGRLAFHPECPVCRRERLVGVLVSEGLVSARAQAVLASGVLALSGAAPAAVVAAEPDQEQQGAATPEQAPGGNPADSPDFDPGGESTDLPFTEGPAPQAQTSPDPSSDDTGPLEREPARDTPAPVADPGDEPAGPGAQQQASPPPAPPAPAVPEQPAPSAGPPSAPPAEAPTAAPAPPTTESIAPTGARKPPRAGKAKARSHEVARSQPVGSASGAPSSTAALELAQAPAAASAPIASGGGAKPGDRSHAVRAGESLWSIANDLLGGGASAARIAREVNRLWELNKERIGTGDPDLLMVGTRLRLR